MRVVSTIVSAFSWCLLAVACGGDDDDGGECDPMSEPMKGPEHLEAPDVVASCSRVYESVFDKQNPQRIPL